MRRLTTSKGYLETHFKNETFELRALRETGTTTKKKQFLCLYKIMYSSFVYSAKYFQLWCRSA